MDEISSPWQSEKLVILGQYKNLSKIREFISQITRKAGFSEEESYNIQLAVDEACSNIIEHGYGRDQLGNIECICDYSGSELIITLRDFGRPYNFYEIREPDLNVDLDRRNIGGLGVYFIKSLMDDVHFNSFTLPESKDGLTFVNELVLIKRKKS